jgi:hypothetical protein
MKVFFDDESGKFEKGYHQKGIGGNQKRNGRV